MANSKKNAGKNQQSRDKNRSSAIVKKKPTIKSRSKENIPVDDKLNKKLMKPKMKTKESVSSNQKNRSFVTETNTSKLKEKFKKNRPTYVVEAFLGMKKENGQIYYLVKWKGWALEDSTWEPLSNLDKCERLLKEYNEREAENKVEETSEPKVQKKKNDKPSTKILDAESQKGKSDKSTIKGSSTISKPSNESGSANGVETVQTKEDETARNGAKKRSNARSQKGKSDTLTTAGDSSASKVANQSGKPSSKKNDETYPVNESENARSSSQEKDQKRKRSSLKGSNVSKSSTKSRSRSRSKVSENFSDANKSRESKASNSAVETRARSRSTSRKTFENVDDFTNEDLCNGSSIRLSLSVDGTNDSLEESQGNAESNNNVNEVHGNSPSVLLKQYRQSSIKQHTRNTTEIESNMDSSKSAAEKIEPPRKQSKPSEKVKDSDEVMLKMNLGEKPENKKKESKNVRPVRPLKNSDRELQPNRKKGDGRANESNEGSQQANSSQASSDSEQNVSKNPTSYRKRKSPSVPDENSSPNVLQESNHANAPPAKKGKQLLVIDENQNVHLIPRKIQEAVSQDGQLKFKVMLKNSRKLAMVDSKFMNKNYAELVMDYYEERIIWK